VKSLIVLPIQAVLGLTPTYFPPRFRVVGTIPTPATVGEPVYLEYREKGFCIVLGDSGTAECVQLFGSDVESGYAAYRDELPFDLTFASDRQHVRQAFGLPARFDLGGGSKGFLGGTLYPWDLFARDDGEFHFEYASDARSIRMISIMASGAVTHSLLDD
jgi:hypothetical protein